MTHNHPVNTADGIYDRAAVAVQVACKMPVPEAQEMPRSGIIDGVSNDVKMPLSVSPRLA